MIVKAGAALLGYALLILLARMMETDAFGVIAALLSAAALGSVLGSRGQHWALLHHLPTLRGAGQDTAGFVARSLRTTAFGLATLGGLTALAAFALGLPASLILPALALYLLIGLADWIAHLARAHGALLTALVPRDIAWRLAAIAALALLPIAPVSAPTALILLALTLAACLAVQAALLAHSGLWPRARPIPATDTTARPFWIASFSAIAFQNADTVLVALILGPELAALYFAANRLALGLSLVQTSTNIATGPEIARTQGAPAATVRAATRTAFWPTLFGAAGLVLAAPVLLPLFGPAYAEAAPALWLLCLAAVLNAGFGAPDLTLGMCGKTRTLARTSLVTLPPGLALIALGAALGGITGAALGSLAAITLRKAVFWHRAKRDLGLRTDILAPGGGA